MYCPCCGSRRLVLYGRGAFPDGSVLQYACRNMDSDRLSPGARSFAGACGETIGSTNYQHQHCLIESMFSCPITSGIFVAEGPSVTPVLLRFKQQELLLRGA